jgi:hypothetical protein
MFRYLLLLVVPVRSVGIDWLVKLPPWKDYGLGL